MQRTWMLAAVALLAAGPRGPAQAPTPVAVTGRVSPTGDPYFSFGGLPVLGGSGQVGFSSSVQTTGGFPTGLFAGPPGALQTVAFQNQPAPGGAGNYSFLITAPQPSLNAAGQVAFVANVTAAGTGVFAGPPGTLQAVAVQGQPAPGGGVYNTLAGGAINAAGQVAFTSTIQTGPTSSARSLYAGAAGAVQPVAVSGTPAPLAGGFGSTGPAAINAAGQVAFAATVTSLVSGQFLASGVYVGTPGSVQQVARRGDPAPAGGNYNFPNFATAGFPSVGLNAAGQVAFRADLTGGSAAAGVFAGTPGAVQAVAVQGQPAPAGGNYNFFVSDPLVGASGRVAFLATLAGGTATSGVFAGTPGAVGAVAVQGQAAPGGGSFGSFPGSLALNGAGLVAFTATLAGTGVTPSTDAGLYAGTAGGLLAVVRKGDAIDVDPGPAADLRTVSAVAFLPGSGGEDGRGMAFTDAGLLAYRLTFTDGSSGVFTSVVPVPEPAGLTALAAAGVALLRRTTRRCYAGVPGPRSG